MTRRFEQIVIALVIALIMAGVTLVVASAQGETPQPAAPATTAITYDTCVGCHQDSVNIWQNGLHAQAYTDTVFMNVWNTQGKPDACLTCHTTGYDPVSGTYKSPGVGCESCHSPIPANHPTDNMPVDKTPNLCGKCHSDPRFSTDNWKLSAHYQQTMSCAVCHDPHTAGMKPLEDAAPTSDASFLCENCHKNVMENFPASKHAEAGVTCVKCHLATGPSDANTSTDFVAAHRAPDHSFVPTLDTCSKCHASQMHAAGEPARTELQPPSEAAEDESETVVTPEPLFTSTPAPEVSTEPAPVSPLGFAGMAGLLGLAGGMVLAPWLERAYRLFAKGGNND